MGIVALTSGRRDAPAERDKGNDVFTEERTHALDQLPPNARVTADEGVHADEDGAADPRLWHARGSERVQ